MEKTCVVCMWPETALSNNNWSFTVLFKDAVITA
jgi:hypothetical protein